MLNKSLGSNSKLRRKWRWFRSFQLSSREVVGFFRNDYSYLSILMLFFIILHIRERRKSFSHTFIPVEVYDTEYGPSLNSTAQRSSDPPSYLPLAQHLRNTNMTKLRPSLNDMVYGSQRHTRPDLEPTFNLDLSSCSKCRRNRERVNLSSVETIEDTEIADVLLKIVSFYNIRTLMTVPCLPETPWILQFTRVMKKIDREFIHYCALSDDSMVLHLMRSLGTHMLHGTEFVVYNAMKHGRLPTTDLVFIWHGLEKQNLDEIHDLFRDVVAARIKYTLVGNSPGSANAILVENEAGTYSIARPHNSGLNVRAFPLGFNEAERVIPMMNRQILLYNTSLMRDSW